MVEVSPGVFALEPGDVVRKLVGSQHITYVAKNSYCCKLRTDKEVSFPELAPNISTEGLIFSRRDSVDLDSMLHSFDS